MLTCPRSVPKRPCRIRCRSKPTRRPSPDAGTRRLSCTPLPPSSIASCPRLTSVRKQVSQSKRLPARSGSAPPIPWSASNTTCRFDSPFYAPPAVRTAPAALVKYGRDGLQGNSSAQPRSGFRSCTDTQTGVGHVCAFFTPPVIPRMHGPPVSSTRHGRQPKLTPQKNTRSPIPCWTLQTGKLSAPPFSLGFFSMMIP